MEPDPSVFLRAIRREALSPELFTTGLRSGASPATLYRAAEGLAQLLLRHEKLPTILRMIRPRQVALLRVIVSLLDTWRIAAPREIAQALESAEEVDTHPGDHDVSIYDQLNGALAAAIRALRQRAPRSLEDQAVIRDHCKEVCAIEHAYREAYNRALAEIKGEQIGTDSSPPLAPPTAAGVTSFLRQCFPEDKTIEAVDVERVAGINSKEIFFFDIQNSKHRNGKYVLRREPADNLIATSLAAECDLLRYLHASGLPVPRAIGAEADGSRFGGGFVIMEKASGTPRSPETLGERGGEIMAEIARIAARIHATEIPRHLPNFADTALSPQKRMLATIDQYYARWLRERNEESAVGEAAYIWLRANVGCIGDVATLVHGDFNLRNILLNDDRVSTVLDWELSRTSHPAEDLAYIRANVEAATRWDLFLEEYHLHSKYRISESALRYFEVWCYFWQLVIASVSYSGFHQGRHSHYIFASCAYVEYREKTDVIARILAEYPVP